MKLSNELEMEQAVHNAQARVRLHIAISTARHSSALADAFDRAHSAWRDRHFLMHRDLRGIALYPNQPPVKD